MKLRHIAIAAAFAAAGHASFAATTFSFHLSGSSALQKVVAKAIANNCSSLTTLSGLLGSAAAGAYDNANGQSQTLYQCTVSPTSTWGTTYQNNILNIYLNTQGSAFGVFPVAYGLPIPFIDASTCGASTCTGVVNVAPDAGLSDLEPTLFNDPANHPVAATPGAAALTIFPTLFSAYTNVSASAFASSKIAAVQTFGLAVNNNLLAALQADQGLTASQIPTVSSSAFATIYAPGYSGGLGNWSPLFTNGGGVVNNQVNICSRLPGSGTKASAQAFFLQYPFSNYQQTFATAANDNTGDTNLLSETIGQNNPGTYEIGEYDNSGGVTGCLTAANNSGGYAIGLLSTDRASGTASGYTFVNLDGSVPNASAAKYGKYQWVYEAYFQVSKTAADAAFANAFYNSFKTPANITLLGSPSTNGVMAAVSNCPNSTAAGDKAVCAHVSRSGNSKAILKYVQ